MPGFVDTGLNFVHVDDVAEGHLAALQRGRIGERYILGGENVVLADMLAEIARLVGRRPPRLRLPRAPSIPVAYVAEAMAWLTGREPFTTAGRAAHGETHMFFTAAKAERDLGYRARPYRQAHRRRDRLVPRRRISGRQAETLKRARLVGPERRAGQFRRRVAAVPLARHNPTIVEVRAPPRSPSAAPRRCSRHRRARRIPRHSDSPAPRPRNCSASAGCR